MEDGTAGEAKGEAAAALVGSEVLGGIGPFIYIYIYMYVYVYGAGRGKWTVTRAAKMEVHAPLRMFARSIGRGVFKVVVAGCRLLSAACVRRSYSMALVRD